jgi:hypothetical protein
MPLPSHVPIVFTSHLPLHVHDTTGDTLLTTLRDSVDAAATIERTAAAERLAAGTYCNAM